ncbi:MAG TPA: ASCH domain-containing protein [Candidatus Limnocylindrales bacterium]|nr:ASCH domain-containing protein [Candidatus Limnocylindrales bacterium]
MTDDDLDALPRWGFATPGPLREELTALALAGTKTTTAGLQAEFEADGDPIPVSGERSLLVDSDQRPVAVVETVSVRICRLADVDDEHARDEGEGYTDAAAFRVSHERYWSSYLDTLRTRLGDPSFTIGDDTPVVLERFRVLRRFGDEPIRAEGD